MLLSSRLKFLKLHFVHESLQKHSSIPETRLLVQGIHKPVHHLLHWPPVVGSPVVGLAPGADDVQKERSPSDYDGAAENGVEVD